MTNNNFIHSYLTTDPKYAVYILYQQEVYNSDHVFLQSMMDWIYMTIDSPYKFKHRNTAHLSMSNLGITLKRGLNSQDNLVNTWDIISFKLKHLKEIYVDKRHKDTCVLVSKISQSSFSNYIWKKANPGNFTQFKPATAQVKASNKSFLVTVIKFKEGHGQLLQSIQTLDKILNSFSSGQEHHHTSRSSSQASSLHRPSSQTSSINRSNEGSTQELQQQQNNIHRRVQSNAQTYFNQHSRIQQQPIDTNGHKLGQGYQLPNVVNKQTHQNGHSMLKKEPNILPRPLSTSSIRDVQYGPGSIQNSAFLTSQRASNTSTPSRHSLTPTAFNYIQHQHQQFNHTQQSPILKTQYGVFPIRRSASRLSYNQPSNNSFDNISEIGYTQYAKKIDKNQQRNQLEATHQKTQSFFSASNLNINQQQLPMTSPLHNRFPSTNSTINNSASLNRISRNQRPLNSVHNTFAGQMAPRSSSSNNNERLPGSTYVTRNNRTASVTTPDSERNNIRHDYFSGTTLQMKRPSTDGQNSTISASSASQTTSHNTKSGRSSKKSESDLLRKNSMIDANLDIIKAELETLRLNRASVDAATLIRDRQVRQKSPDKRNSLNIVSQHHQYSLASEQENTENASCTAGSDNKSVPAFLKNEPSRLQAIIDTFNSYEKNLENNQNSILQKQSSIGSSNTINNASTATSNTSPMSTTNQPINPTSTNNMNVYANPNGTGSKPYQRLSNPEPTRSNRDSREVDDIIGSGPKPNLNGLIKYFSTNPAQQESPQFSKAMTSSAPKKQDTTVIESTAHSGLLNLQQPTIEDTKRGSPIGKKTGPVNNSTSPDYTKPALLRLNRSEQKPIENGTNINPTASLNTATGLSTSPESNRMNSLFNKIFNKEIDSTTAATTVTGNDKQVAAVNNEHLTMSVDSLENIEAALSQQNQQQASDSTTTKPVEPTPEHFRINSLNALNNDLYNRHDINRPEKVYDLATFGLDMNVVQGDLEPIFKPVLQKKSAKQAGRKRTFANMVWPMSAEEEKIMRSNSPFVVPEVIVTRNDSVKSILKKNIIVNTTDGQLYYNRFNAYNEQSTLSPKKRVDFHKNFLFVNVFDRVEPDASDASNSTEQKNKQIKVK